MAKSRKKGSKEAKPVTERNRRLNEVRQGEKPKIEGPRRRKGQLYENDQ